MAKKIEFELPPHQKKHVRKRKAKPQIPQYKGLPNDAHEDEGKHKVCQIWSAYMWISEVTRLGDNPVFLSTLGHSQQRQDFLVAGKYFPWSIARDPFELEQFFCDNW